MPPVRLAPARGGPVPRREVLGTLMADALGRGRRPGPASGPPAAHRAKHPVLVVLKEGLPVFGLLERGQCAVAPAVRRWVPSCLEGRRLLRPN